MYMYVGGTLTPTNMASARRSLQEGNGLPGALPLLCSCKGGDPVRQNSMKLDMFPKALVVRMEQHALQIGCKRHGAYRQMRALLKIASNEFEMRWAELTHVYVCGSCLCICVCVCFLFMCVFLVCGSFFVVVVVIVFVCVCFSLRLCLCGCGCGSGCLRQQNSRYLVRPVTRKRERPLWVKSSWRCSYP